MSEVTPEEELYEGPPDYDGAVGEADGSQDDLEESNE